MCGPPLRALGWLLVWSGPRSQRPAAVAALWNPVPATPVEELVAASRALRAVVQGASRPGLVTFGAVLHGVGREQDALFAGAAGA